MKSNTALLAQSERDCEINTVWGLVDQTPCFLTTVYKKETYTDADGKEATRRVVKKDPSGNVIRRKRKTINKRKMNVVTCLRS